MPRRSGGGRAPSRGYSTSRPAPAPVPAPAPAAAPAPMAGAQPKQPGMFAQMATTAAGVAVGSAIGHTVAGAVLGGGGSTQAAPAPVEQAPGQMQQPQQQQQQPCQWEVQQFLQCAQTQGDITLCEGFNEALRQCKVSYGIQQ